ncbi:HD domain-containing protein [Pelagicoccus sp. NFK12]|uniref:5'-deoxynucleotidase n=1 Tax=Pelagicoccus enzymogenes TaxID=2773457 RepID=A0A927F8B7_9BACT|nr:HD domain-containing protein [Pelagicoccus enzymogenes]MBD5780189.1 HD domain-containing protein [Pelagicoccus enzymogenes]MDQ8198548.1 HD domain-containing protein [Pelagicoccus enzymogenes]
MPSNSARLAQQMAFIIEADKLKNIFRQSYISDASRRENDAEHSWHLALMAITLHEHANDPDLDLLKILRMVIVHDIVEIDAGDTYIYDEAHKQDQAEREQKAAERLFGLLPSEQAAAFRSDWDEFEAGASPEARFAKAIDRLHPMLLNHLAGGKTWSKHGVVASQVRDINRKIGEGSQALWDFAQDLIEKSIKSGSLPDR